MCTEVFVTGHETCLAQVCTVQVQVWGLHSTGTGFVGYVVQVQVWGLHSIIGTGRGVGKTRNETKQETKQNWKPRLVNYTYSTTRIIHFACLVPRSSSSKDRCSCLVSCDSNVDLFSSFNLDTVCVFCVCPLIPVMLSSENSGVCR